MKSMIKKMILVASLFSLVCSFTACSHNTPDLPPAKSDSNPPEENQSKDYFEELGDFFYGCCYIFGESKYYKVFKDSDEKIYCAYYADNCAQNELSSEILTYSVSGNIASLKGESGTEFAINITTKDFVTEKIVYNGNVYDLMDVWYEVKSTDLSNFLKGLPNNTKDTPYKIKLLDLTYGTSFGLKNTNKFVSLTIPDSVTSIRNCAFDSCLSLTSISIPDSVTSIGEGAFYGCSSLTSITIPNSVTSIGITAFYGCSSLTSISIPDSVTSIGEGAFYGCSSLTSITIPNSVTSISDEAFLGCSSLSTINYKGTEQQWNAISKGSLWNEGVPSTCMINFNS